MAKRYGEIKRDRSKVERAALRSVLRPGKPFPEHAERAIPINASVYRLREGKKGKLYQGWMCLRTGRKQNKIVNDEIRARSNWQPGCGEGKGATPTDALRAAAHDFAQTLSKYRR